MPKLQLAKQLLLLLFVIPLSLLCFSQATEQWVSRYNGPDNNDDNAASLAVDRDGNVYITGHSLVSETGFDYATVKYDAAGNELWAKRYTSGDVATSLTIDSSGNVYVTGYGINNKNNYDYATIKYDKDGNERWVRTFNGPGNGDDQAVSLVADGSGNVYVTGHSLGSETGLDYATIKYDTNGNELWAKRYNGMGNSEDKASSLAVDASGNVYITGYSQGSDARSIYATIKYDTDGNELWVREYNGPGIFNAAIDLAVDGSGNLYVTGYSVSTETNYDYATIKYDAAGNELWVGRYNGPGNGSDYVSSLSVDAFGNVFVTGRSPDNLNDYDFATVKYDASGNELWVRRYNGPGNSGDVPNSLAVDQSGNVYVTGNSQGTEFASDYATIKYDPNGNELWIKRYNGSGNSYDDATSITVDGTGNVYVTGSSIGNGTGYDYTTIKYVQVLQTWYRDADKDGYGNRALSVQRTTAPQGYIADSTDCDDSDPDIHPSPDEYKEDICSDGKDNDCDGLVDEDFSIVMLYRDKDGDGFGDATDAGFEGAYCSTSKDKEFVPNNEDCNDEDKMIHPGAAEICGNAVDDNCNGKMDDGCILPVITCPGNKVLSTDAGMCSAFVESVPPVRVSGPGTTTFGYTLSGATEGGATGEIYQQTFGKGVTTVTYFASDGKGQNTSCSFTVTVEDQEVPVIANISTTPTVLWPPNHKLVDVQVNYTLWDNCGATATLSVTGNDGANSSDWQVVDAHHVRLRAERSGSGAGRTYTITITAADGSGNTSIQTMKVLVPHDHSQKAVTQLGKEALNVQASPNPSRHDFALQLQTTSATPVSIRVVSAVGKLIELIPNTGAKGVVHLGSKYPAGTYYAEVLQGSRLVVVKLLKLTD
jgi:hypothetical protein